VRSAEASSSFKSIPAQKSDPTRAPPPRNVRIEIGPLQRGKQRVDHGRIDCVALIGAVQCCGEDAAGDLDEKHDRSLLHLDSMRSSAVKHLSLGIGLEGDGCRRRRARHGGRKFSA